MDRDRLPHLTFYTLSFNFHKLCVLPAMHLRVLRGSQKQTAIFSVYSNNLSVFITEAERFHCVVRTRTLNQIDRASRKSPAPVSTLAWLGLARPSRVNYEKPAMWETKPKTAPQKTTGVLT
jgi:hypothetical protein